jgi:hypothetical protein
MRFTLAMAIQDLECSFLSSGRSFGSPALFVLDVIPKSRAFQRGQESRADYFELILDPNALVDFPAKRDNIRCSTGTWMSQKYRQHGYQDRDRERSTDTDRQKQSGEKPAKKDTFGPRALQMPGTHSVSRCAQCGTLLTSVAEPVGKCPKCGFELHSCRQCTYFDTSSRFECTQPIPERIPRKDERNQCTFFSMRVRVEKETSTPSSARPMDARAAFENLFKK